MSLELQYLTGELALEHRGPDGAGVFITNGLGLFHRRLAITDLSERSAQPMTHPESGDVLSLNGEIYNFQELRGELESSGDIFRSDGDAEVLLRGLVRHGTNFISRVDGDFAFAFWQDSDRTLVLGRDRFGIKPLYWTRNRDEVIFASEVKGILAAGVKAQVNTDALLDHLQFRYAQSCETIFDGIVSVQPGAWIKISTQGPVHRRYWQIDPSRFHYRTPQEGMESLASLWTRSVRQRLRSDVAVGITLSGGIDSGFLAHSAKRLTATPLHAVTYDMPGSLSESSQSRQTCAALGFRHTTVPHADNLLSSWKEIIRSVEEPLGDSILGPTFNLFRECRKHMKVVLSGEGADEIFGGYTHQLFLKKYLELKRLIPKSAFALGGSLLEYVPTHLLSTLAGYPAPLGEEARARAAALLQAPEPRAAYDLTRALMTFEEARELLSEDLRQSLTPRTQPSETGTGSAHNWGDLLQRDISAWLPNYGLMRVDKLSMAHGLECRVPYLQHEFAEAALAMTLREDAHLFSREKSVLRKLVSESLPGSELARRKKRPFFLPGPKAHEDHFRDACDYFLSEAQIKKHGLFDPKTVRELVSRGDEFLANKKIICVLHIQIWCDVFQG